MNPRHLKYFVTIARCGNMTLAAQQLHVAQPALSQHVARLEESLGVPLFNRHARGVTLTPEGLRLLERAGAILRQLEQLPDDVRVGGERLQGTVSLCLAESIARLLAIPLYRRLEQEAPEIVLQLSTGTSHEARTLIEARRVDLAVLPAAFELPRLEVQPLFEERFYAVGSRRWLGNDPCPIPFAEAARLPLAATDRSHDQRKLIERAALSLNCPLHVRYELNNAGLIRQLVREGMACAILGVNSFLLEQPHDLIQREVVEPRVERTQSLAWMLDYPLSAAGQAVRDMLRQLVAQHVSSGRLSVVRQFAPPT